MKKIKQTAGQIALLEEAEKQKRKGQKRIVSIKTLRGLSYSEVDLNPRYKRHFGDIEGKTIIFAAGPSGEGKSVYILQLCAFFAKVLNMKVMYNNHEEGLRKTLQERANEFIPDVDDKLVFMEGFTFDEMMPKIKTIKPRVLVIDSVQEMGFTPDQLVQLQQEFKRRNIIIIMVSFATGISSPTGADARVLMHKSDIKMYFHKGHVTIRSRYLGKPVFEKLFDYTPPKTSDVQDEDKPLPVLKKELKKLVDEAEEKRRIIREKETNVNELQLT